MKNRMATPRAVALALTLVLAAGCQSTGSEPPKKTLAETNVAPGTAEIEQDALAIMKKAASHIRTAQALSVSAVTGFDVLQPDGQKIEFGSTFEATIQRPNRARMHSMRRDGDTIEIALDGNDLWMYSPTHNVYAHEPQPGDIDASFDYMLNELDISTPLNNLFSEELGATLDTNLVSCYLVGNSTIGERTCHHIAARNDYADYQLWIDTGDVPALRRLVVSYREEEGHPQYWAYFTEWDFAAKPASRTFIFQPPAGVERIRLAHAGEGKE